MEIKLAEDGEILTRGGAVFKGYFKDEQATNETIDKDGWLYTGDVGTYEGDFVKIVDRKRDIAGSCDVILQHKDTGMLCLADFKTQEESFFLF